MNGNFSFSGKSAIIMSPLNPETRLSADYLARLVKNPSGIDLPVMEGDKPGRDRVFMVIDTAIRNREGYALSITPGRIIIRARTAAGLFYAVQSIRQLLPVEVEKPEIIEGTTITLPACEIVDEPRFAYRGMHLDVGRHMFPVGAIKKYIDMLALHKINTFHWHLTEDQGWRVEILKYPLLTKVGAYREETLVGHFASSVQKYDGKPYGGYYTRDEIKDIVEYAGSRFVTVIPEIEMPGHSLAALAAYPALSCTGGPFKVATKWGIFEDVYCAGKEETFTFLEDVLSEVMDLFPGKYMHVGGDECPKARWEKCPLCQKRIKEEGLKDETGLQSYFIRRIEKFLASRGKKLIGWDEILEGGIAREATVMSWRGTEGGVAASRLNHDVIMTPCSHLYLDYYQADPAKEPLAIGGYTPLEKVYSFNPVPRGLSAEEETYIIGVQGNLWTEFISSVEHLEYMAYPRTFAVAETGWTPERLKDFNEFLSRLEALKKRYDVIGINYFRGEYSDTKAPGRR
jgi:hexosaminidase